VTSAPHTPERRSTRAWRYGRARIQLAFGDADRPPADADQPLVPAAVALERLTGLVKAKAVRLDGDPLGAPDEFGADRWLAVARVRPRR
jgi:hypothetical protein